MFKITLDFLEEHNACSFARTRFARLFGTEVEITPENIELWRKESHKEGLSGQDPGWIIWVLLRDKPELATAFSEYVCGKEAALGYATCEVGRYFLAKRCAKAIKQAMRAVA